MKISELPKEIREKALKYSKMKKYNGELNDDLGLAFEWKLTPERYAYWEDWNDAKPTEKPIQYQIGIDTFERMESNCTLEERLSFVRGNIDKYNWRTKGQDKQDFEKIINYANWALKQLENGK